VQLGGPAWTMLRVLVVALCATAMGCAQEMSSAAVSVAAPCAPVRSDLFAGLVPSMPDAAEHPKVAAALRLGYTRWYGVKNRESAGGLLQATQDVALAERSVCGEALAEFGLAEYADDFNFNEAKELYERATELFRRIGSGVGVARAEFEIGRGYATQVDLKNASAYYVRAAQGFDAAGDVRSSLVARLANVRYASTKNYGELVAEAHANRPPCVEAQVQQYWSDYIYTSNHFAESMAHSELAAALYSGCPTMKTQRAALLTSMGRMERQQGRPLVALEHYREALRLQRESGELSYVPQTYNAMCVAYESMQDFAHAVPMYQKGLAHAEEIHSAPYIAFLKANPGTAYADSGEPKRGIPLLLEASKDLPSEYLKCVRFGQLGNAYARAGDKVQGIARDQQALAACRQDHQTERIMQNLDNLSVAELSLGRNEDALRDSREALVLVEETRAHLLAADAYKQGFTAQTMTLYSTAIAALTALHRPGDALETAEQARARAFLDLMGSQKVAAGVKTVSVALAPGRKELMQSPEQVAPLRIAAMLETRGRLHSTLVAYWIAEERLYVWAARPGEPVVEATVPVSRARLAQLVAATHRPAQGDAESAAAWRTLYRLLIAPVEGQLPKGDGDLLTIVPSGPLFALSFAALKAPDGHYLAERFRTHTIATVGLLQFTQRNAATAAKVTPHFLFVADPLHLPNGPDGHALPALRGTGVEVSTIAELLPAGAVTRLEGRDASIAGVTEALTGATTIHFATHAVIDDADPGASFLALEDEQRNGKLSVADIYGLHLHSRLVVLSACRTGLGKITGDGVSGMSRAFFYAGAGSVLSMLWDIADQPTAEFLPRLYAGLAAGQTSSAALRSEQLSMLRDLRRGKIKVATASGTVTLQPDPAYWAAFSLAGEP